MEKSPSLKELALALNMFQSEMGTVAFDSKNPFFNSKYASLSALVSTARPILAKNGLSVSQLVSDSGSVTTMLLHSSGEFICSTLTLKAVKDDPQGQGSAITYARRYAYAAILGIVSDEDDDGNAAMSNKKLISNEQLHVLRDLLIANEKSEAPLCRYLGIQSLENLQESDYKKAEAAIKAPKRTVGK